MLWRPEYSNRELEPAPMPPIKVLTLEGTNFDAHTPGILLGGFDFRAQAELGVWRRLIADAGTFAPCRTVFLLDSVRPQDGEIARAMTPKSAWHTIVLVQSTKAWIELIKPDRPERSFGALVKNGILNPLMVGIPTEEGWDNFREALDR